MCAFCVLLRNDKVADALIGMGREMKLIIRSYFVLYVYVFYSNPGCIATPVVEARACNLWDMGSSPSDTLLLTTIFAIKRKTFKSVLNKKMENANIAVMVGSIMVSET